MWSSDAGEGNSQSHSHSNSSTKIPSSSSSSSTILLHNTPRRKTLEEVWKEINLPTFGQDSRPSTPSLSLEAPLPHKATAASASAGRHSFRGMILQDFLAGPFKDRPVSAASGELPQLTLPPTILSLSSSGVLRPGFEYSGFRPGPPNSNSDSGYPSHVAGGCGCGSGGSDEINVSRYPASSDPFFSSKKLIVDDPSCVSGGDRRYKRMIKNRESAARSRARKQARIHERAGAESHPPDRGEYRAQETKREAKISNGCSASQKEGASKNLIRSILRKERSSWELLTLLTLQNIERVRKRKL